MADSEFDVRRFAKDWTECWNRRDLAAILSHYSEDVRFVSPRAARLTGNAVIVGKAALGAYWARAMEGMGDVRFVLEHAIWDAGAQRLAVVYRRRVNGGYDAAVELFHFGPDGLVDEGEAMYGAAASRPVPVA
jgi:ketosteroid isomerase-like protein